MHVLIVDDEPLIATGLRVFLEDEGFTATVAASGEQAIEFVQQDGPFDVCIMDMRLPGMDGNAAIESIHEICPDIQFIVHTGSVNYRVTHELTMLGIRDDHLFRKPLADMTPIAAAIESLRCQK